MPLRANPDCLVVVVVVDEAVEGVAAGGVVVVVDVVVVEDAGATECKNATSALASPITGTA